MYAQCPECLTIYKIGAAVLGQSHGSVRCGHCNAVFDALRTLTILHELVHVVAGPNECRAMAFAARIENLASGHFTDVSRYWQANSCNNSGFRLP